MLAVLYFFCKYSVTTSAFRITFSVNFTSHIFPVSGDCMCGRESYCSLFLQKVINICDHEIFADLFNFLHVSVSYTCNRGSKYLHDCYKSQVS